MSVNVEDIQNWIDQIMVKKGLNNYKLNLGGSSSKGDGYLGEINFVNVVASTEEGEEKVYDMVVKSAKVNEELRQKSPIAETYLREIHMYTEVFPTIEKFQKESGIKTVFKNYAKCYNSCKSDKKEAIILANLKSLGYKVHDRTVPQSFDHALLVFRNYAKWHGASLALKTKKPELFKSITKNMTNLMAEFLFKSDMVPLMKKSFQTGLDVLRKNGKEDAALKIEKYSGDVVEILGSLTVLDDKESEGEGVILHGDCWNNNMMFKYKNDDSNQPIDLVFIDFQLSRVASPILDLSYYLYATADKTTLDRFDYLLEEYHKTLRDYLHQYKIDCNDILTLDRLKSSWKKYGRYGLGMCAFILRVELCEEDEVIDFTEVIKSGKMEEQEVGTIRSQEEYDRRLFNVYNHFAEKFL